MDNLDILAMIDASDKVARRCIEICGAHHGSAWLLSKSVRFFEREQAAQAVTIPVYINAPVMRPGEATIHRDGRLEMRVTAA